MMNCYNESSRGGNGCCGILTAIVIIAAALTLALGVILGAIFSAFVLANIAAFAVFAVIALLLLVILLIIRSCRNCRCY